MRAICFIVVLLYCFSITAQDTLHYSWDIRGWADTPFDMTEQDDEGNFYAVGSTGTDIYTFPINTSVTCITKLSNQGYIDWKRTYFDFKSAEVCVNSENELVTVGHPALTDSINTDSLVDLYLDSIGVYIFGDSGEVIESHHFSPVFENSEYLAFRSIQEYNDAYYILYYEVGNNEYRNQCAILKLDKNGRKICNRRINTDHPDTFLSNYFQLKRNSDSTFVISGHTKKRVTLDWFSYIIEIDTNAQKVWEKINWQDSTNDFHFYTVDSKNGNIIQYDTYEPTWAEDRNWPGSRLTYAPVILNRYSLDRERIYRTVYRSDEFYTSFSNMVWASNHKIYMAGSVDSTGSDSLGNRRKYKGYATLMCFSPETGEVEWIHNFLDKSDSAAVIGASLIISDFIELRNGNLALLGSIIDTVGLGRGNSNHWIGIFTPEGCLLNSCGTEILHTQTEHAEMPGTDIKVYPNPAGEVVNIEWDGLRQPDYIDIYDSQGRRIKHEKTEGFQTGISISVSSLEKGMYYIRYLDASGHSGGEKLIIR